MSNARETIVNAQSGETTALDTRTVTECRDWAIAFAKHRCAYRINEEAPDYRQRNAALGLLTDAETAQVVGAISAARAACAATEQAVFDAAQAWDGTEATRAAVCDAIEEAAR